MTKKTDGIEEAVNAIRQGRPVVLVRDLVIPAEEFLVVAASTATTEAVDVLMRMVEGEST